MGNGMYDKVSKKKKVKMDKKLTTVMIAVIVFAIIVSIPTGWLLGYHYRYSGFVEKLSYCTSYANKKDSITVEMDGKTFKISDENLHDIFNYITINGSGKESKVIPDGNPVVLDYGNGGVMKLWDVPGDKYTNSNGLFVQFADTHGNEYSYVNYKITLGTIVTRYLIYDNEEMIEEAEEEIEEEELLISENETKKKTR